MTLEEQIKEATPLGGTYQHDCPGGWTAYAGKNARGGFLVRYVKTDDVLYHEVVKRAVESFINTQVKEEE